MAMLWYPGQDVDFITRLGRLESEVRRLTSSSTVDDDTKQTLAQENSDLRMRIDDLEESIIQLTDHIAELQTRLDESGR
jgi:septal ring factor EnvC (AmiA/AmiB activator)